jgi:coiled-coil domain-containing protein 15
MEKEQALQKFGREVEQRVREAERNRKKNLSANITQMGREVINSSARPAVVPADLQKQDDKHRVRRVYQSPAVVGSSGVVDNDTLQSYWRKNDDQFRKQKEVTHYVAVRNKEMDAEREETLAQIAQQELQQRRAEERKMMERKMIQLERKKKEENLRKQREEEQGRMQMLAAQKEHERRQIEANLAEERKNAETLRYIEALRAQLLDKIAKKQTTLPPLCPCGLTPLEDHAAHCANNCVFYRNPLAYSRSLASLLQALNV